MNFKLLKYYDRIFEFGKADVLSEPNKVYDFFSYLLEYDFENAAEIWEYLLEVKKSALSSSQVVISLIDNILKLFVEKSASRTSKLLIDNAALRTAIYQRSTMENPFLLNVVSNLLITSKLEAAEEFLKVLQKNEALPAGFSKTLREIIEMVIEGLRQTAAKKNIIVQMPRKVSAILLTYINKIKGADKALLTQKIKEVT